LDLIVTGVLHRHEFGVKSPNAEENGGAAPGVWSSRASQLEKALVSWFRRKPFLRWKLVEAVKSPLVQ